MSNSSGVRKGVWSKEEDELLRKCIETYGEGKWNLVPRRAGLDRCRKSCRLRWLNYLKPNIKRGGFSADEVDMMIRLHKLLGNRWSLIAGRLPGRTSNDVKNFWNTHMNKRLVSSNKKINECIVTEHQHVPMEDNVDHYKPSPDQVEAQENEMNWLKSFLLEDNEVVESNANDLFCVKEFTTMAATKLDDNTNSNAMDTSVGLAQSPWGDLSFDSLEFWDIFLSHSS